MKIRSPLVLLLPLFLTFWAGQLQAQTIQEQIDAIFARPQLAGNVWSGYVVSESGNLVHYSHLPDTTRIPASNAKITTTSAAYELLGPNYTFESRVYANGTITGGVLNGDLNLVVEHDPTWSTRYFSNARTPLNHIATRVRTQAGITAVTGVVRVYGASVYNHTSTGNLGGTSQTNHNINSATAFRDALIANGVAVSGGSSGHTGFSPPGVLVYTHQSSHTGNYNLNLLIRPLNKISINPSADMMLRHIGYKLNGNNPANDNYASGRVHVEAWMASKPFDSTGFAQGDGSGLSRVNQQSSRMMVSLFRYMAENHPNYEPSYTIACTDGTLGNRICGADTTGRVHGKTGSLNDTITLSGYVRNRHNGERVYFSFLHNRTSIDQSATRLAIDDAVRVLAGDDVPVFRPPGTPDLFTLRILGTPPNFVMQWGQAAEANTYRIYRSVDGGPFELRGQVNAPTSIFVDPALNNTVHAYRITAENMDGEGIASDVLLGRVGTSDQSVLIVRGSPETAPGPFDPLPPTMSALVGALEEGIRIEMAPASRVGSGNVDLTRFNVVQWYFEHDTPQTHTLSEAERNAINSYLQGGRGLLISGSKLATNMDPAFNGDLASGQFLHEVLMHEAVSLDAETNFMNSQGGVIFQGISVSSFGECDISSLPVDVIAPLGTARSELVFQPNATGTAAISYDGDYRIVVFPGSFGCLFPQERPGQYMDRIMDFLVPPDTDTVTGYLSIY